MFYQHSVISNYFNCQNCSKKYDQPKLLECGKTICFKCAQNLLLKSFNNQYDCFFCLKKHSTPSNGFPLNDLIFNLMKELPSDVYRNEQVEVLKFCMKSLEHELTKIKMKSNDKRQTVKDHCNHLRSKTNLNLLTKYRCDDLLQENIQKRIDLFEKESLERLNNSSNEYNRKINQTCDQINNFLNEQKVYLEKFRIDNTKISAAIKLGEELKERLNVELNNYDENVFVQNQNTIELDIMLNLFNKLRIMS